MKRIGIAVVCSLALVAGACGSGGRSEGAKRIKVVVLPYMDFAPLYIAKRNGYFADEGLSVTFVEMFNSQEAMPGLAKGDYDVVGGSVSAALLNSIARGADVKVVADKSYYGPQADPSCRRSVLLATPRLLDSGELAGPRDLKGRKIRANPTNFETWAVSLVLEKAHLSLDDVEIVDIPVPNIQEALGKNEVDLAVASEPTLTRIVDSGKGKIWTRLDNGVLKGIQVGLIMYGPNLLSKDPAAGERFVKAYLKGVRAYERGKTRENVSTIAKATELEPSLVRRACWPVFHRGGRIDWPSIDRFQRWAKSRDLVDQTISEDEFWTPRFVEAAR